MRGYASDSSQMRSDRHDLDVVTHTLMASLLLIHGSAAVQGLQGPQAKSLIGIALAMLCTLLDTLLDLYISHIKSFLLSPFCSV